MMHGQQNVKTTEFTRHSGYSRSPLVSI